MGGGGRGEVWKAGRSQALEAPVWYAKECGLYSRDDREQEWIFWGVGGVSLCFGDVTLTSGVRDGFEKEKD